MNVSTETLHHEAILMTSERFHLTSSKPGLQLTLKLILNVPNDDVCPLMPQAEKLDDWTLITNVWNVDHTFPDITLVELIMVLEGNVVSFDLSHQRFNGRG